MKTAFFFDSKSLGKEWSFDLENNALSGTDSILLSIFLGLKRLKCNTLLLCTKLPQSPYNDSFCVKDVLHAYELSISKNVENFVFVATSDPIQFELLNRLDSNIKLIAWAHCTPSFEWINAAYTCPNFFRLIAVTNIQKYGMAHSMLYKKTIVIPNFIDFSSIENQRKTPNNITLTYIGALRESKGFHHLSEVWSDIHNMYPEIKLYVCGSPGLYSSNYKLGLEGIAEEAYEKKILSKLGGTRESAQKLGVNFLGSISKNEILAKISESYLVIVNPNTISNGGSIETFCVSAAEALSLRVPVVGGADGGLLEVVGQNIGGLLVKNSEELKGAICQLITNQKLAKELGEQGYNRIKKYFEINDSLKRWQLLLNGNHLSALTESGRGLKKINFYMRSAIRILLPMKFVLLLKSRWDKVKK